MTPNATRKKIRAATTLVAAAALIASSWLDASAQMTMLEPISFGALEGYDSLEFATIDLCMPQPIKQEILAEIQSITLDDPSNVYTGATMVVSGGQQVIVPANLLVDLPANRLTLRQIFDDAPPSCAAAGESGLAASDSCLGGAPGATVHVLANLTSGFDVVAGHVEIEKGPGAAGAPGGNLLSGVITSINHTDGYLVVGGTPGVPSTGTIVRINDPEGVHTVQQGVGCTGATPNCSADVRFGLDPQNYTVSFGTGYPACIASTETGGNRVVGSDATGSGDPFCPDSNRPADPLTTPVADSTRFAPILLGDSITVHGNYERVAGTTFFSAHTAEIDTPLLTADDPTQPDYFTFADVIVTAPGFSEGGFGAEIAGFSTLMDLELDIFSLHKDPATGGDQEQPLASTVGNPATLCQGVPVPGQNPQLCTLAQGGGIWLIEYEGSFVTGVEPGAAPCTNLFNAGIRDSSFCQISEQMAYLSPIFREVVGRTRHKAELLPGVVTLDIKGAEATNGEYLTPIEVAHPPFAGISLPELDFPYLFAGEPWNMDRRLGPGGCVGGCESLVDFPLGSLALNPFPYSGLDPREHSTVAMPESCKNLMFRHWPFGPSDLLAWPPPAEVLPPPLDCDDGNPCTTESCDPDLGCVYANDDGAVCSDGDPCTTSDVCSGGQCVADDPLCQCALTALVGPAQLPAIGQSFAVDLMIDTASNPLGAYSIALAWDPGALQLDSVTGGGAFEFSGAPLCNVDAAAGTASCAATQTVSLATPTGPSHVATANMTVVGGAGAGTTLTATVNAVIDTDALPIPACNSSDLLALGVSCGDVNADATINVVDALLVAQHQVGLRTCGEMTAYEVCDVAPTPTDGACGISDALRMAQCSVGLISCDFTCSHLACE